MIFGGQALVERKAEWISLNFDEFVFVSMIFSVVSSSESERDIIRGEEYDIALLIDYVNAVGG